MTHQNKVESNSFFLLFLLFFGIQNFSFAQTGCAGSDAVLTICNKDQDPSNQSFNLFNELGGSPTSGGFWYTNNPANFYALDRNTGIVNLWKILNSGTHVFTYTNTACNEESSITIHLGGYSGEDNIDGSANACSSETDVNMHRFLGSEVDNKIQDLNGIWEAITPGISGYLDKNIFNAFGAGPGVYEFTYTVPAVETCISEQSRVILEVHPSPNPGYATGITVCVTDDLSAYRNVNLNSHLTLEDSNGTWSETTTGQLSDLTDNIINIEEIRDNFGYGDYSFKYTVYPSNPVCEEQYSYVIIQILPTLEGEFNSPNFCETDNFTVNLTYNKDIFPNGLYELGYRLNLDTGVTRSGLVNTSLTDGTATFNMDKNLITENIFTTINLTSITGLLPLREVCDYFDVTETRFIVTNPRIIIDNVCEESEVQVAISNILDTSGELTNGIHNITYTITAPSSTETAGTIDNLTFTNGAASFYLPIHSFTETGDFSTSIVIENILEPHCNLTDTFTVTAIPEAIDLSLIVDNSCNATQIDVLVEAPFLSNGVYNIAYDVIEQYTGAIVINNTIEFTGGTANYQVDVAPLEKGNYTISVRSTQNDTTPCRIIFEYEETQNFAVKSIPNVPEGNTEQTFCLSEFENNTPTLEDLVFTASGDPLFYATITSTEILEITEVLVNNEDYFVSNLDNENNCEATERLRIHVTLLNPETPITTNATPVFCGSENATLADIAVLSSAGNSIIWYDAVTNENQLPNTTVLENAISYFAASQSTSGCTSNNRLEITPIIHNVPPASFAASEFSLCGLDNPTIADLKSIAVNNDYETLWFTTSENGNAINDDTLLSPNTVYYAENYDPDTGCSNPNRFEIIVDLTNCNPADYDFFIPDGFSPNGDNKNDTYFVPNIGKIFPGFTLEIKNRYGRTMFTGNQKNPAWNGSLNGSNIAPDGVYFYIIYFNKEGFEPKQGRLYLNR